MSTPTKQEVLATAGVTLANGILHCMSMDPHDAAVAAYIPRVTPSVEELESQIRQFHADAVAA